MLAAEDGVTTILTNRHVVNDAPTLWTVNVITSDGVRGMAHTVRLAPNGMDLAVIDVAGIIATPTTIAYDGSLSKGQDVVVLGSPVGLTGDILQGSVAKGIVSNFETRTAYFDDANYRYDAIQIDAAINHGNSGGGLFLLSNGNLIGINTLGGASQLKQGINFAIDIRELRRLPDHKTWPVLEPARKCPDGTAYDACSTTNVGYVCTSGKLVPGCKTCGCPSDYPFCPNDGNCFSCPAGANPFQASDGTGFCCAAGYTGTGSGYCI